MSENAGDFRPSKRTDRAMRKTYSPEPQKKPKGHFGAKPLTHGSGASGLSWIGAGLFLIGICIGIVSGSPMAFWVLAGLAVQLWIVSAVIRPIEAIFTLLNERLPK